MANSHFVEELEKIKNMAQEKDLSIQDIFDVLGEKSHLILILFFVVPFMQPLPLVGLSTPLGAMVIFVSFFLLIHKPPWLPRRFLALKVSKSILLKTVDLIEKIWLKMELFIQPRWHYLYQATGFRILNFVLVAVCAFLLALPLPIPFTNTIPAAPIVLSMIGQLEEDGLIIFLSFLSFTFCLFFFTGLGAGIFVVISQYYDKIIPILGF